MLHKFGTPSSQEHYCAGKCKEIRPKNLLKKLRYQLPRFTRLLPPTVFRESPDICHSVHFTRSLIVLFFPSHYLPVASPLNSLPLSLRCNHSNHFKIPYARTNSFKFSFLPSMLLWWNNLSDVTTTCKSLSMLSIVSHHCY